MPSTIDRDILAETQDGQPVKVAVRSWIGKATPSELDLGGHMASVEKASSQAPTDSAFAGYAAGREIEVPPVDLDKLLELALNNTTHMACCVTKATDVVGHGYTVRPRSVLFPRVLDAQRNSGAQADGAAQQKVLDFLDLGWGHGESFTDIMYQTAIDMEVLGGGYVEIERDAISDVVSLTSVKGVTVRIARGGPTKGFWQVRGRNFAPFLNYSPHAARVASLKTVAVEGHGTIQVIEKVVDGRLDVAKAHAGMSSNLRPLNELLRFTLPSSADTFYGVPDIIPAAGDVLVQRGTRDYRVSYFDAATIPRLMVFVKGEVDGEDVTRRINEFLKAQKRVEVLNKVLVTELPEGTDLEIKELKQCRMDDGDSLMGVDNHATESIMRAHRVPMRAIPAGAGGGASGVGEADVQRYVASVVRPRQRRMEEVINWVIREETGVDDWVINFNAPSLLSDEQKARIRQIASQQGYASINEMRLEDSKPPLKGGDEPILRMAGQPPVPLSRVDEMIKLIGAGAGARNIAAQIPPKPQDGAGKALYITDPRGVLPQMDADERDRLRLQLEELVENRDDVGKALGLE